VIFAEGVKNPVADIGVSPEGFVQRRKLCLLSGVKRTGYLVDIVPDASDLAEELAQRFVVGGRAALGAGAGVTVEGGGPQEGSEAEAGIVGLGGDSVEFVRREAHGTPLVALPFIASAGHGCTKTLSWGVSQERADILLERQAILGGLGREHGLLLVG
jgi:hypothetical protein